MMYDLPEIGGYVYAKAFGQIRKIRADEIFINKDETIITNKSKVVEYNFILGKEVFLREEDVPL